MSNEIGIEHLSRCEPVGIFAGDILGQNVDGDFAGGGVKIDRGAGVSSSETIAKVSIFHILNSIRAR